MNETDRRRELLESARDWYGGRTLPPAVHPRYRGTYRELYGEREPAGTFWLRLAVSCILFLLFVAMDYRQITVAEVSGNRILQAIEAEPEPENVWSIL